MTNTTKTRKFFKNLTNSCCIMCGCFLPVTAFGADYNTSRISGPEFSSRWEGSYIGVNIGAAGAGSNIERGAGNKDVDYFEGTTSLGINAGFNRQLGSGNWLWGGEIGYSTLNTDLTKTDPIVGNVKMQSNGIGEALLRAGYGWERLHLYGTVGLAVSDIQTFGAAKEEDSYRAGVAFGLGAEFKVTDRWSTKVEAMQYNFGEADVSLNGTKRKVGLGAGVIRIGLSRKF